MLECPACLTEFHKLKALPCGHGMCLECVGKIDENGIVTCPLCRAECKLNEFGVKDLPLQFAGEIECVTCKQNSELKDCFWCENCLDLVCKTCKESNEHQGHSMEMQGHLGPLDYSTRVVEKYAELHTNLCSMQKGMVQEYFVKVQDSILKQLDDDLQTRLEKFKTAKRLMEDAFDQPFKSTQDSSSFRLNGNKYVVYTRKLQEIAEMQNCPKPGDLATNTGVLFKPPHVDQLVSDLVEKQGNITSGSSVSYRKLMPSTATKMPVGLYLGAGVLSHPCDLTVLAKEQAVLVSSANSGIISFKLATCDVGARIAPKAKQQYVCVDHCPNTGRVFVASFDDYKDWNIRIFADATFAQELECIPFPGEPKIGSSWYRWLTVMNRNFLLVSAGDKDESVLYLLDIAKKSWALISHETGSTYRRAAIRNLGSHSTMVYVPDMQKTKIRTFTINGETGELTGFAHIAYDELDRGIPVAVDLCGEALVIGLWLSGNVILADLVKGSSKTLACVGPRELLSLRIFDNRVFALRKKLEVVEVYNFSRYA